MDSQHQESHERPPAGPSPIGDAGQARVRRRDRLLAGTCAVAVHLTVLVALLWPHAKTPPARPDPLQNLTMVSVMDLPKPPGPPDAAQALAVRPTPPQLAAPKPNPDAISVPAPDNSDLLSEAQLAGATSAGEGGGGGGGGCDMARAVQQALRRDSLVRAAVEGANRLGKAIMLWNGDWVQTGGQDGKGLSAAREAIMWEVAFAPVACRNQRMHGMVLLSLADGSTRFAVGSGEWRWSDLLGVRQAASER
jgi:hypothetical protein